MARDADWKLRSLDAIGLFTVAVCLTVTLWLILVRWDQTKQQADELRGILRNAEQDRQSLRAAQLQQVDLLTRRQRELDASGRLPQRPPLEAYFQELSALAARRGLTVIRHQPLTEHRYPGLVEHCYAYEVSGTYPSLARFLRDIEKADYWADVGYLKLDGGPLLNTSEDALRVAQLTISLFSAPAPAGKPGDDG